MEPETLNFSEDEIYYDEEDELSETSLNEYIDPLDTSSQEKIICIELINNNKIYLNYKTSWTLRDVIYYKIASPITIFKYKISKILPKY
jgi:hypothetical protein